MPATSVYYQPVPVRRLTSTDPPQTLVAPLAPKSYRGRPKFVVEPQGGNYARLKALGVRHIQIVLSDHIGYPPSSGHWPGDDGNFSLLDRAIEELMNATATMQDVEWDVWEEPNGEPHNFWQRSLAQFLVVWTHAVRKIRSLRPAARIVGPSANKFDMEFLAAVLQHANSTDTLPDVVSWHELDGTSNGSLIESHVAAAVVLTKPYGIERFSINEIIGLPEAAPPNPAIHVDYLATISRLSRSGVESAMHSCWSGDECGLTQCTPGNLDGLIGCHGRCGQCDDTKRRCAWFVYEAFAKQIGSATLASVSHTTGDAIATTDSAGIVRALLSYSAELPGTRNARTISVAFKNVRHGMTVSAVRIPAAGWTTNFSLARLMDNVTLAAPSVGEPLVLRLLAEPDCALAITLRPSGV